MVNKELEFRFTTKELPLEFSISERLVFAHFATVHFQEAIDMAATTKGSDVMNAIVSVAECMADVGTPPVPALERLTQIGDRRRRDERSFINLGMADIYGMLGRLDKMRTLLVAPERDDVLWTVSPYIYAGKAYIRKGDDPTPILEEAMDRIARNNPHYDNYFGKTMNYVEVAKVFHKAGPNPKVALSRAEETIDTARKRSTKEFFDYRAYEELGVGYAACGFADDALRMVDLIGEVVQAGYVRDCEVGRVLQRIAQNHLSQGDYEAAVAAARRLNWNMFTAKMLAHKAVGELRQGIDATSTIDEAVSLIRDIRYEAVYEEVYPVLGLALALSGRTEEAETVFRKIRAAIDEMDILYKSDVGFKLAKAVGEAGYDAIELYRQAFIWADEYREENSSLDEFFGMSYEMYENGISVLIEMGQLDLARKYLDNYQNSPWPKSRLLGKLAKKEAEIGNGVIH